MKKTRTILATLILLFHVHAAQAQVTHPDTMMHRIFSTLKNKDEKAYVSLYPNKDQMVKLMSKMVTMLTMAVAKVDTTNKKKVDEAELQKMILAMLQEKAKPEQMEKEYTKFGKKFRSVIEQGESKGIDWNNSSLTSYTYDTVSTEGDPFYKAFDGLKTMKGKLNFSSSGKEYELAITEVLFLPEEGGWYGADLRWSAKDDDAYMEKMEVKDITLEEGSDVVEPPPPPTTKQKTKAKTSATKTKTKKKS